jgi:hypothetical protein
MYLILWITSIIVSYFIAKQTLKFDKNIFENNTAALTLYIIFACFFFFPINTVVGLIVLFIAWVHYKKLTVNEFALKLFSVKVDNKK